MILSYVSHKEFNLEKSGTEKLLQQGATIAYRDLIQGFRKVRPTLNL